MAADIGGEQALVIVLARDLNAEQFRGSHDARLRLIAAFAGESLPLPGGEAVKRLVGLPLSECVARLAPGAEAARQARLVEGLAAPEQQADAVLQLAVPDDRVAFQEPHRMGVPDLVLRACFRKMSIDGLGEGRADALVADRLRRVVREDVLVDRHGVVRNCKVG